MKQMLSPALPLGNSSAVNVDIGRSTTKAARMRDLKEASKLTVLVAVSYN
jgi:hypothetical protein